MKEEDFMMQPVKSKGQEKGPKKKPGHQNSQSWKQRDIAECDCVESRKTNKQTDQPIARPTDRPTDLQADQQTRKTNRPTGRPTNQPTDRQAVRQTSR